MSWALAVNLALVTLGFVGAIVAIGGETWAKGSQPVLKRITRRGWVAIACLLGTLSLGVIKEIQVQQRSRASHEAEASLRRRLDRATSKLETVSGDFAKARRKLERIEPSLVSAMATLTARIPRESDFAFVSFRGRSTETPISSETRSSLRLYGGDEFEFHHFCDERPGLPFGGSTGRPLVLRTPLREYTLAGNGGRVRISGPIGEAMPATIINGPRYSDCGMKVIIHSTDRTRYDTFVKSVLRGIEDGGDTQSE